MLWSFIQTAGLRLSNLHIQRVRGPPRQRWLNSRPARLAHHGEPLKATPVCLGTKGSLSVGFLVEIGLEARTDLDPTGAGPFAGLVGEGENSGPLAAQELYGGVKLKHDQMIQNTCIRVKCYLWASRLQARRSLR